MTLLSPPYLYRCYFPPQLIEVNKQGVATGTAETTIDVVCSCTCLDAAKHAKVHCKHVVYTLLKVRGGGGREGPVPCGHE